MIKSVKKAIDILYYLSNNPETPVSLKQIAADMDMNKSTCAHILDTLCSELVVERVSRQEGYCLGPGAYMFTRHGMYKDTLIRTCIPVMQWLHSQLNATILLTTICDGMKYIIYHVDADEKLITPNGIIQGSIETTASGKLIMAYMNREALSRVNLRQKDDSVLFDPQQKMQLREELKEIRENGYSHIDDVSEKRQSFAFRVHDDCTTIAAVCILFDNKKDSPAMRNRVVALGKKAADEISRRIKFQSKN